MEGPDAPRHPHPRRRAVPGRGKAQCRSREIQAEPRPHRQGQHAPRRDQFDRKHRRHRSAHRAAQSACTRSAVAGAAHRPCRHHDLAQGDRGDRRQVRPASGLRRPVQLRVPHGAGPHRAEALSRLLGCQIDPLRPGDLPAQPQFLGAAREPSGRGAGYRRVHPADRRARGAEGPQAEDRDRRFARLHRHHGEHRQRFGAGDRAGQERTGAPGVRAGDRSRGADPGRLFRHVHPDGRGQSAQLTVLLQRS